VPVGGVRSDRGPDEAPWPGPDDAALPSGDEPWPPWEEAPWEEAPWEEAPW